ncbi:MAG: hypothetical protein JSV63_04070 [Candidatus Aenigmatarchaeota archaeon]|nr:MAG: hypothetical protein JSV63_04070 [Candidatus Aenigmarchaeota archaeon]
MKSQICSICLKSGILCRSCEDKVKSGDVSESELKVAGMLLKLSEDRKVLKNVRLVKVVELPSILVVVCGKDDAAKFVGAGGHIVKKLEKELGKHLMIAEEAADVKEFAGNLLKPIPVLSVNTLYKDGEEVMKVVTGKGMPHISQGDFSDVMRLLYGKGAEMAEE